MYLLHKNEEKQCAPREKHCKSRLCHNEIFPSELQTCTKVVNAAKRQAPRAWHRWRCQTTADTSESAIRVN